MVDTRSKSIYGPVSSWRLGHSLGVDLLCVDSICSFACVYCQLGKINRLTTKRQIFVPTATVIEDLFSSDWPRADILTFSGSGEPTLALNLGETIEVIRFRTGKPIAVLTNSTLLWQDAVRREIALADRVFCKLDAWSDDALGRIDRPASGIVLERIIFGIKSLRAVYKGFLAVQTMLLGYPSQDEIGKLTGIFAAIDPDEVELNLPLRPIPEEWFIETRGNNTEVRKGSRRLRTLSKEEVAKIGAEIAQTTGLRVITPFDEPSASTA